MWPRSEELRILRGEVGACGQKTADAFEIATAGALDEVLVDLVEEEVGHGAGGLVRSQL